VPLPKGTRYRVKTTKSGKKIRLAWSHGDVIEAKNIETGEKHTPSEFKADKKKAKKRAKRRTQRSK
jgi:hypothetical protein